MNVQMSALLVINFVLIGLVAAVALTIMVYWNWVTGGRWFKLGGWRFHASGRSLMGLLGIIFLITGNAVSLRFLPMSTEFKAGFYFALYLVFAYSLARIGFTIRNEVKRSRSPQRNGRIDLGEQTPEKEESHG